jgi:hypothetical protein
MECDFTFLGRPLPRSFELRVVSVAPGCEHVYVEDEWRDAIVVVEEGAIDLETICGARRHFERGAILWLTGMGLRALLNPGTETALLSAVTRR